MSASPYKQLEQEFKRLYAFRGALSLLRWDAAVMMPRGSADVRGEQLAALETEHHALLPAPRRAGWKHVSRANSKYSRPISRKSFTSCVTRRRCLARR